jgi:hypothetical protein
LIRGREVHELKELQRQGMSIQGISKLTGWDRRTSTWLEARHTKQVPALVAVDFEDIANEQIQIHTDS